MITNITKKEKAGNINKRSENTVTENEKNEETDKNIQKINSYEEMKTTKNVTKLLVTQQNHEKIISN